MVCATLGHQSLTPYAKGLSAFNAFLAMLVVAFSIIGCASYSNSPAADYRVPWATVKYDRTFGEQTIKVVTDFGLRSFVQYAKDGSKMEFNDELNPTPAENPACHEVKNNDIVLYKDCANAACWNPEGVANPYYQSIVDTCAACKKAGTNSVSALIVAVVFAVIAVIAFFMRTCNDGTLGKDLSIIAVVVSFAFGVSAYGCAKPCKEAIEASTALVHLAIPGATGAAVTFGVGIKFVTAAWALLLYLIPMALLIPVAQVHEHAPVGKV